MGQTGERARFLHEPTTVLVVDGLAQHLDRHLAVEQESISLTPGDGRGNASLPLLHSSVAGNRQGVSLLPWRGRSSPTAPSRS